MYLDHIHCWAITFSQIPCPKFVFSSPSSSSSSSSIHSVNPISVSQMQRRKSDSFDVQPEMGTICHSSTLSGVRIHQRETARARGCLVFWTGRGCWSCDLMATVILHIRPSKTTSQHKEGGADKGLTKSITNPLFLVRPACNQPPFTLSLAPCEGTSLGGSSQPWRSLPRDRAMNTQEKETDPSTPSLPRFISQMSSVEQLMKQKKRLFWNLGYLEFSRN